MHTVATLMTEKRDEAYCRYSVVKLDSELVRLAHGVALLKNTTFQEWLSDVVNEAIAKELHRKPVKRKPPKPRRAKPDTP